MPTDHAFRTFVCGHCGQTITVPSPCKDRFCAVCGYTRRRRVADRMDYLLAWGNAVDPRRIRFLTLTLLPSDDPSRAFSQLVTAFAKLRRAPYWRDRVFGGFYVVEATHSSHGWHVHLHALVQADFLPQRWLSRTWANLTGAPIVDIRMPAPGQRAATYLTKYLRKVSVDGPPRAELSQALASRRMFEPFGAYAGVHYEPRHQTYPCPRCKSCEWLLLDRVRTDRWDRVDRIYRTHPPPAAARP